MISEVVADSVIKVRRYFPWAWVGMIWQVSQMQMKLQMRASE